MELEGLSRGLSSMKAEGIPVGTIVTDRHVQIRKWLRDTQKMYPGIRHQFDVWHMGKGKS
jgi:solute carrier family 8 (sodium/calcium exchanger)